MFRFVSTLAGPLAVALLATACLEEKQPGACFYGPCDRPEPGAQPAPQPTPDRPPSQPARPISEACDLDLETEIAVSDLYRATEASVHELITCGGAQVNLAQSMMAIILLANEGLFEPEARDDLSQIASYLGLSLSVPFEQEPDGTWSLAFLPGTDSRFALRFYAPGESAPITDDPFRLESYLTGVESYSYYALEELLADPSQVNLFVFGFDSEGPLARLLNDGEPLESPFFVELSIVDLLGLVFPSLIAGAPPDFGPFASLADVEIDSTVWLHDPRANVEVEYRAEALRVAVGGLAGSSLLAYDLDGIWASDGDLELWGRTDDLSFVGLGSLAGTIDYTVPVGDRVLAVTSDFGAGAAYPTPHWDCDGPGPTDSGAAARASDLTLDETRERLTVDVAIALWRTLRAARGAP